MLQRVCLIGLGNPGSQYKGTRHNIGFDWLNCLAETRDVNWQKRFDSLWAEIDWNDLELHLLKPQTFMNRSGAAVRLWKKKYPKEARLVVITDDLDLPVGRIRLRLRGSDGGHRGLRSVSEALGSQEFPRLRIGVGRAETDASDYVLSSFRPEEKSCLEKLFAKVPEHAEALIQSDWQEAMNIVNAWRAE